MNRRKFVQSAAWMSVAAGVSPLSKSLPETVEAESIRSRAIGGTPLKDRYELTLNRVLSGKTPAYTQEFLLADVRPVAERRFTEYSGDLSGRYIGALATAAQSYGGGFSGLPALVEKTVSLQKPDGYFGAAFHYDKPTDEDLALLWGNGRLLVGMIERYKAKPDVAVLASCKRLGDWLVRVGPLMLSSEIRSEFGAQHFASSYICWMQQTEGLSMLYAETKDDRYRKLAEQIAAVIERRPGDHVHGYLTSLRGVMDLHAATGDERWLRQCESAWADVAQSQDLLITGGVPEGWSPNGHRTEGCAEADWVRLSLALWKATGNAKYLEMSERAIFNEFAFNQFATGDFGHRLYSETGLPGDGSARAWWCCTLHGLRAFPDIQERVFVAKDGEVDYDLPMDGRIESPELSAAAESTLADDGIVMIRITQTAGKPAALSIRQPEWAQGMAIRLNGALANFPPVDGRVRIERVWKAGDQVTLKYPMKLRTEAAAKDRVAYWYGPWLLGASATDNPNYFNELTVDNKLVKGSERPMAAAKDAQRSFAVPVAATAADSVHAEFPDQPGTVVLRAIAEQTGLPTTAWELRFRTAG